MTQYIARRLLIAIPMLFLITLVNFVMQNLAPGDPLDYLVPVEIRAQMEMTVDDIEVLRARYGLDKPIVVRYFRWMSEMLRGNFGYSVGFAGGFKFATEQVFRLYWLRTIFRIHAGTAQVEHLLHSRLISGINDIGLCLKILVDKVRRVVTVGGNAA